MFVGLGGWNHYLLVTVLVVTASSFIFGSAFALNTNDSPAVTSKTSYDPRTQFTDCSAYGGDPNQDGICAHWKDGTFGQGLHIDFTNSTNGVHYRYDLSCVPGNTIANDSTGYTVCPSTTKKDIYIELDCMTGQCPSSKAVADVVKVFFNNGIQLHVQMGENQSQGSGDIGKHYCNVRMLTSNRALTNATCNTSSQYYQSYPWLKQNFFGTVAERAGNTTFCPLNGIPPGITPSFGANSYNCLTAKRQVFHYVMYVNYQAGNIPSSGWSEILGNDFLISMGNYKNNGVGNLDEQEGALMHELGHNLGLDHGGVNDANNCKPNYLSAMNYVFMFNETADPNRPLDYSNATLGSLNEASLTDSNIGSYKYPAGSPAHGERKIFWSSSTGSTLNGTTGVTDDWNNNGKSSATYSQILNNIGPSCTASQTPITLTGFNDWSFLANGNVVFPEPLNFRPSQNFYSTVLPTGNVDPEFVPGSEHSDTPLSLTLQGTATSIASGSSSVERGSSVTLTATVTDTSSSPTTPTGSISWSDNNAGGTFTPNCSLSSGSCSVTYTSSPNAPSSIALTATYGGDSSHSGSGGTYMLSSSSSIATSDVLSIVAIAISIAAIIMASLVLRRR